MDSKQTIDFEIANTTKDDLDTIYWLFEQAMNLQGKNGYKVWDKIDKSALEKDIENKLQYKIIREKDILCIFSIQYRDLLIWREKDNNDAIYLHRAVVNPNYKGQNQFKKILIWTMRFAKEKNLRYVRMDTWADNTKLIDYYKSYGFKFIENYKTTNSPSLPIQNRNLNVALLEMSL